MNSENVIDHVLHAHNAGNFVDRGRGELRGSRTGQSHCTILHVGLHRAETETAQLADSIGNDLVNLSLQLRVGNLWTGDLDPSFMVLTP